jgi:hypothetical protein
MRRDEFMTKLCIELSKFKDSNNKYSFPCICRTNQIAQDSDKVDKKIGELILLTIKKLHD